MNSMRKDNKAEQSTNRTNALDGESGVAKPLTPNRWETGTPIAALRILLTGACGYLRLRVEMLLLAAATASTLATGLFTGDAKTKPFPSVCTCFNREKCNDLHGEKTG